MPQLYGSTLSRHELLRRVGWLEQEGFVGRVTQVIGSTCRRRGLDA